MSETFLTIAEAKSKFISLGEKNGSFIATVITVGDLKSGTKNNEDYSYKKFTLKDDSDTVEITTWGNDVNRLKKGVQYKFTKPYWNTYKETAQISFNQYGSVEEVTGQTEQTRMEHTAKEQTETPERVHISEEGLEEFTLKQNTILSQMTKIVYDELQKDVDSGSDHATVRGDIVWVRVLAIYQEWNSK